MEDSKFLVSIINPYWTILILIILDCTIIYYWKVLLQYKEMGCVIKKKSVNYIPFFLVSILFCTFCVFNGDWYYYINAYIHAITKSYSKFLHFEDAYVWIINNLTFESYILFRLIVWGGAIFFYYQGFKRLRMNDPSAFVAFLSTTLYAISYTRTALGLGILFCGYCYLITANKKIYNYILGFTLIGLSLYFHRSMFVGFICAIASLLPPKKWVYLLSILSFPVILSLFSLYVAKNLDVESEGYVYTTQKAVSFGPGVLIYDTLTYLFVFSTYIYLFIKFIKNQLDNTFRHLFIFMTYSIIMWILFYIYFIMGGTGGLYFSQRIFQFIFITFPVLFAYMLKKCSQQRLVRFEYYLSFFTVNYIVIYHFYLQLIR